MKDEKLVLECACSSDEHTVIAKLSDDDNYKEVYLAIYLTKLSFWKRLCLGVKYIFGYQCRFGAFEEVIWTDENIPEIEKILAHLSKNIQS